MMASLVRLITLPYIQQNRLRAALTILGVALGVSVFVAIRVTNLSTLHAFEETLDAVSGRTQLQVGGDIDGIDASLYPRVRFMPGVAAAVPVVMGYGAAEDWDGTMLLMLGVDVFLDRHVREYRVLRRDAGSGDPLQLLLDPATLFVSETFAHRHQLGVGDSLTLLTPQGRQSYTIQGLLSPHGPATALGGNFAVMDISAAQQAFQKPGRLDRIDIVPKAGIPVDALQEALQARLGAAVTVQRPSFRNASVEKMLQSFQVNLTALSMIALFVGMFLIYNTLSSAVVERRKDIGILRALGASRAAIAGTFLAEGLVVGLGGTLLGLGLGLVLARLTLQIVSHTLVSLYLIVAIQRLMIAPGTLVFALVLGLLASLVSVALPVREAIRVQPVDALVPGQYLIKRRRSWTRLLLPGIFWLVLSYLLSRAKAVDGVPFFGYLSAFTLLCGFSLLMPAAVLGWTKVLAPVLLRLFRAEGGVAGDNIQSALTRSSVAAASLMIGVAMVVSMAMMIASFKRTVYTWVDQTVKGDIIVTAAAPSAAAATMPLPEALARALTDVNGVLEVDALRVLSIPYQGRQIILNVGDIDVFGRHTDYPFIAGEPARVFAEVVEQDSVIVSENFQHRFGVGLGDHISLPTPQGPRPFRIAGVSLDYSSDQGTIVMHWGIFRKYWTDRVIDSIGVFLKPGAEPEMVAQEIQRRFGATHRLFLFSNRAFKQEIYQLIDQSFVITYALEIIAMAVGIMGVVTALYTSVLERQREISVLRALGALRRQVGKIIVLESGLLGLLGVSVGTVCGGCLSLILIYVINRQSFGWTLRMAFPTGTMVLNLSLVLVAALGAGLWPAYLASRVRLAETLRME